MSQEPAPANPEATPDVSVNSRSQTAPAPQTVVQPPTPITPQAQKSLAAGGGSLFANTIRKSVVPSELVKASKDATGEMKETAPTEATEMESPSLPSLPPHLLPHRGSSTPVPQSEVHETARKESDDSALLRSPPTYTPHTQSSSTSPRMHLGLSRSPSPSSPDFRPRMAQRKETSSHVVRETTSGTHTLTKDGQRVINQYSIGKSLGKGAYASVSLGIDVGTGEQYAVKEFSKSRLQHQAQLEKQAKANRARRMRRPRRPGQAPEPETRTMQVREAEEDIAKDIEHSDHDPLALIRREIAVMKKLDHPNLTHLYEAISVPDAESLFLVLEYLPGGVLMPVETGGNSTNQVKPPFPEGQTREYLRQMLLGLEYLHANGIAHRDIKPDNILFNEDRTIVKLVDFGVSEMFQGKGDDRIKGSGGSPAFLSPESFTASSSEVHGKAVDVWALGVTLYCMLTGRLPFDYPDPMELFAAVRDKDPVIPEDWHDDLKDLVLGMLRKDPEERFSMNDIRNHPWVVSWGANPMMDTEENLFYFGKTFEEPTEEEINKAITSLRSVFTVVRAVNKMRKVVLPQFRKTTLNSVIAESPTELARDSGSVDSYMLPGVVTPSAMSDDGAPDVLSASPEASADLLPDSGPHEHHVSMSHTSTAWAKLRPIKTDLVQQGKSDSVPVYTGEDALIDSPGEVASPVEFNSPLAASPEQVASPVAASPQQMNSPVMLAESPIEDSTAHTTLSPATKGLGLSISPTAVKTTPADVQISASPTEDTLVVDSPTDEHFIVDSPSGSP